MKQWGKRVVQWILFWCARLSIALHRPLVIAISGSTDKTLVKETVSATFRDHGHIVRANPKSFNTEIGLPLAILYLPSGGSSPLQWLMVVIGAVWKAFFEQSFPPVLIVELGVDHPGDMEYLLRIVRPVVAIVTTCNDQYLPNFPSLEHYAQEFTLLINAVADNGLVVINSDDERIRSIVSTSRAPVITVGEHEQSSVRIIEIHQSDRQQSWRMQTTPATSRTFTTHRRGHHHRFAHSAAFVVHKWYDEHIPHTL